MSDRFFFKRWGSYHPSDEATVAELNENENIGFGLTFPLGYNDEGFFPTSKSLITQASSNLRNLLLTSKGERVGQPEFGSTLTSVLFNFQDADMQSSIEESINEAVARWLPYITLHNIFISSTDSDIDGNVVMVQLEFSVDMDDPTAIQPLEFKFYRD